MVLPEPGSLRRATPPYVVAALADALGVQRGDDGGWHCPVHDDHTPSMGVFLATRGRPAHGRWKCQGCGEGGDAVDLVAVVRGCSFGEALDWLAAWVNSGAAPAASSSPPASLNVQHIERAVRQSGQAIDLTEAWLCDHKRLDVDPWWVVSEFGLGAAGRALLLPYRKAGGDEDGVVGAARRWPDDDEWRKADLSGSRHRGECVLYGEWRDRDEPAVVLCEGESDVFAVAWWLRRWPGVLVLGVPGATCSPRDRALALLGRRPGRRVVLLADADDAGAAMCGRWQRALAARGTPVGVAHLPPGLDACTAGPHRVWRALRYPAWYGPPA